MTKLTVVRAPEYDAGQQTGAQPLPLLITTGEPAGIGMDIVLQLASQGEFAKLTRPVVVLADKDALQQRWQQLSATVATMTQPDTAAIQGQKRTKPSWQVIAEASEWPLHNSLADTLGQGDKNEAHKPLLEATKRLTPLLTTARLTTAQPVTPQPPHIDFWVIHTPVSQRVTAGVLNVANAPMVMAQLQLAHHLASSASVAAIVTGPLHKSILIDAGLTLADGTMFTGHTEFFMQQSGCKKVVMMLANMAMRVALVTTHLPLREVADAITADNVRQTLRIVIAALTHQFGIAQPKILVCGLNPHAGEGGHLGVEEIDIINPVLQEFCQQGVAIPDALPADTLFTSRYLQDCDAVIAMFHDQGLPVLKSHGFGDTVNITLGLPYIRTSVDHGTALDLAGNSQLEQQASPSSLWQALTVADEMADQMTDQMADQMADNVPAAISSAEGRTTCQPQ